MRRWILAAIVLAATAGSWTLFARQRPVATEVAVPVAPSTAVAVSEPAPAREANPASGARSDSVPPAALSIEESDAAGDSVVENASPAPPLAPALASRSAAAAPPAPPAPPQAVRAAVGDGGIVVVEWLPGSGAPAARYEVRRGAKLVYDGRGTRVTESGLQAMVEHCWDVRAVDPSTRAASESRSACATPPDVSPPTAPREVRAKARSDTAVDVVWLASSDDVAVDRYEVRRGDGSAVPVTSAGLSDTGLRPAVTYCYSVEAVDAAGNRSPAAAEACVTTPDLQPPTVPGNVATTPGGKHAVVVAWTVSTDDVGGVAYEVFHGDEVIARVGGTSLTHPNLKVAVEHCYTVRSYDGAGNRSARSEASCITLPDVDPPTKPQDLTAAANSSSRIALQWTPSKDDVGVTAYEIVSGSKLVASVPVASTAIHDLAPERDYCFEIRALDAAGNRSPASERACSRTAAKGTPSAPYHVRIHEVSPETVTLAWEPSETSSVAYRVYTTGDKLVGATSELKFTDTGTRIKQKCYRVGAVDREFRESPKTIPVCAAGSGALSAVTTTGR